MLKRIDFIDRLADKGYTKKSATLIIDDVLRTIAEVLTSGEDLQFYGFGTFCVRNVADRETTDIKSRERIVIPGHRAPKFVPSASLKQWVREGVIRE